MGHSVVHIPDAAMLADVFTKYLKYTIWRHHIKRIHNLPDTVAVTPMAKL